MYCPYFNNGTLCPLNYYIIYPEYRLDGGFSRPVQPLSVTTTSIKNANNELSENLLIPQFHGAVNPQVLTNINNNIKSDIMEFKTQMETAAKEHARRLKLQGKKPDPYQIGTTYSVTYDKNNILSLSLFFQEFFSGKHNNIRTSYNYDLNTGNPLSLGNLFRPGVNYRTPLNRLAGEQLQANYPAIAANYKGIAADQPFYLDNNSLVIYPRFNEIAPVVSDIPLIRIPFTNLGNVIKPQFV